MFLEAPTNRQGHETLRNTQSIGIRCMVCSGFTESTLCLPLQPVEDTACKSKCQVFTQKKREIPVHILTLFFQSFTPYKCTLQKARFIEKIFIIAWFIANFSGDNVEISIISLTYSVLSVISCLILEVKAFFTIC